MLPNVHKIQICGVKVKKNSKWFIKKLHKTQSTKNYEQRKLQKYKFLSEIGKF